MLEKFLEFLIRFYKLAESIPLFNEARIPFSKNVKKRKEIKLS